MHVQFLATHKGTLMVGFYYATKKLAWEIFDIDGRIKYKIEVPWQNILAMRAIIEENKHGILQIKVYFPIFSDLLFFHQLVKAPTCTFFFCISWLRHPHSFATLIHQIHEVILNGSHQMTSREVMLWNTSMHSFIFIYLFYFIGMIIFIINYSFWTGYIPLVFLQEILTNTIGNWYNMIIGYYSWAKYHFRNKVLVT